MAHIESAPDLETVLVLDFGSQYSQLIVRRVREAHVFCRLVPWDTPASEIVAMHPKGLILSGGPASVYDQNAPYLLPELLQTGLPMLGICYGMQSIARELGGVVTGAAQREYGLADINVLAPDSPLWAGLPPSFPVWMSHGDRVDKVPEGFQILASSRNSPVAAMGDASRRLYGLQFHPEVVHTPLGAEIIRNFLFRVCGCKGDWTPAHFVDQTVADIRNQVGKERVIGALSGGVDSAVAATLVSRAVGDQLTCIFVDHGLLRKGEAERNLAQFRRHMGVNVIAVDAGKRFLAGLKGVIDPEQKRRIIGETFIRVFEEEAARLGPAPFLLQGTLYPDVIESTTKDTKAAARIKTHHNVGGLPKDFNFQLVEPLKFLFKDEVREVGAALGLPPEMVQKQPFPGPGLAVRILGEVTPERVRTLQAADAIATGEIEAAGLGNEVWQYFAVLTHLQSVGVMGDSRTYSNTVAIRAVTSRDGMTADWARLPYDLLARISNRIVNEVPGVNRVVYDISSKPPSTIEWE
jgi:GMP synthase (glutamine-hydrolysing)